MKTFLQFNRQLDSVVWMLMLGLMTASLETAHAAFHNWTGAVNGLWSNTNNWTGGSAPAILETPPVILDFPAGVSRTSVTNDIYNGFFGALRVDSLIVTGNGYHFYGSGGGTNLVLTGNPASVLGVSYQNLYCPATNITFDSGLNLILDNTNTITNNIGSTLDIQASLTGTGGWTFQGLGQMAIDGAGMTSSTGACAVLAGNVVLNRTNSGAIGGPLLIGTTNTSVPASVAETNCTLAAQFYNYKTSDAVDVTIAPSGSLILAGSSTESVNSLTMTGGVVSLAGAVGFDPYFGSVPGTNNGILFLNGPLTAMSSPSGIPARITGHGLGWDNTQGGFVNSQQFDSAALVPYSNPYGFLLTTNTFNVVFGSLIIDTPLVSGDAINSGQINSGTTISKTGNGTLVTTGTNLYDGGALIQQGCWVAEGQAPFGLDPFLSVLDEDGQGYTDLAFQVVVSDGAELVVASSFTNWVPLVLNGFGTNETGGALNVQADGSQFFGGCTVATDASIFVSGSQQTVSFYDQNWLNSATPITGPGALYKSGPGSLALLGLGGGMIGSNYVGTTHLTAGTIVVSNFPEMILSKTLSGPVIIGTNGSTTSSLLEILSPQIIASNVPVTINDGGGLILNGNTQTIGSLNLNGGVLGSIFNSGSVILNGDVSAQNGLNPSYIFLTSLSLGGTNRTFDVATNSVLNLAGIISDGGNNAGIVKTGPGELDLYSANTYNGLTSVNQGILGLYGSGTPGSTMSGTVVSNLAALYLYNGAQVGAEPLTISGNGPSGLGGLVATGTNSWAGNITLPAETAFTIYGHTEFSGGLAGSGSLLIDGNGYGTALFDGSAPSTLTNQIKVVESTLALSKTNTLAIAGPLLIGEGLPVTNGSVVQLLQSGQISSNTDITLNSDGLITLNSGVNGGAGSLSGTGNLALGTGTFSVGYDNASTSFGGNITGLGNALLSKVGTGTFTLTGINGLLGSTGVGGGKLLVNGSLPQSAVIVSNGATLGGNGNVGSLTALSGSTISPGNGIGLLTAGNVAFNSGSTYLVEVNGTNAGTGYTQLAANGTISPGNANLKTVFFSVGPTNGQYTIITNSTGGTINGTFLGLAEGAATTANTGAKLKITYLGGTGKNVVLTQTDPPVSPALTTISQLPGGSIQFDGSGMTNLPYSVWANTNLTTTNWLDIGTATANATGLLQFTDQATTNCPQRFYRLSWP